MELIARMTKESILAEDVFTEIFEQEDEIYKARLILTLTDRAEELGVKTKFNKMIAAYKRANLQMQKQARMRQDSPFAGNTTHFEGDYPDMQCKEWIANENGVCLRDTKTGYTDILACYHPILPIERLKNLETGEEKIKIAYKRNGIWREIIVPKVVVSSANRIVSLAGYGIAVTSENAKYLVRYLSDVENSNESSIGVQYSSSRLGWIKKDFIPYDTEIIFDGDDRFSYIYNAIRTAGDRDLWFKTVNALRKQRRMEIRIMLAASFASVLLNQIGALPFIVDLWGETEGGKSVTLMLAASVWADPSESQYIGDFKTTEVALEAKANLLNNLPLMLDDTSKTSNRIRDNFEGVVYDLCSGKGKSRSDKELGVRAENHWRNCILTNGERPLNSYVVQGGAMNRIVEIECKEGLYSDPQKVAGILKNNFGWAGKEFVQIIKGTDKNDIMDNYDAILKLIASDEKMQKQSISLAVILTADYLTAKYLFKDNDYIDYDEAVKLLTDKDDVSDNERCYRFVLDKAAMNPQRFDLETNCEKWGAIEKGVAYFYPAAFDWICKDGGFSKKSFLAWAGRKNLTITSKGRQDYLKSTAGKKWRCIAVKLEPDEEKNGFTKLDDYEQNNLPF